MRFKEFLQESQDQNIDLSGQDFSHDDLKDHMPMEDFGMISWNKDIARVPSSVMVSFTNACKKLGLSI